MHGSAQTGASKQEYYKGQKVFTRVDKTPEYAGEMGYLHRHLYYPDSCIEAGDDDGKLLFSFIVDTLGNVADVTLLRCGCGAAHRDSMLRMIRNMPRWKPGRYKGKAVPVRFSLPIQMCFMGR